MCSIKIICNFISGQNLIKEKVKIHDGILETLFIFGGNQNLNIALGGLFWQTLFQQWFTSLFTNNFCLVCLIVVLLIVQHGDDSLAIIDSF